MSHDTLETANYFNNHFANVAIVLHACNGVDVSHVCNEAGLDNDMQTPLFELSLFSEADVLKEIYSLKN